MAISRRKRKKLVVVLLLLAYRRRNPWKNGRRWWVHPTNQVRETFGEYHHLVQELEEYPERWFKYFHMSRRKFDILLEMVRKGIEPRRTSWRKPISAREKLVVCLR